jgi:hypothetical protein
MAITSDGRWLAAASSSGYMMGDSSIHLWDLDSGLEVRRFTPKAHSKFALVFSPDDSMLAAVVGDPEPPSKSGTVVVWERETGKEICSLIGQTEHVLCVAFSPDGLMLATGGDDNTVRFWEVRTGIERRRVTAHKNCVTTVAFSPNGRNLASASSEAPVYVWDVYSPPGPDVNWSANNLWNLLQFGSDHLAAMGQMIANADRAIALCRAKIKPAAKPDEKKVRQLLRDLGDSAYTVREKAEKELNSLGDLVESMLRSELAATSSAETAARLKRLLLALASPSPQRMAAFRAMEAVERIGTPQARKLMEEWASDDPENSFTREAKKSLERMKAQ